MLKVVSQGRISSGYDIVLSTGQRIHLHKNSPTQQELNDFLIEYERSLLNAIDLKGEESDVYISESNNRYSNSGEDPTLGVS